MAGQKFSRNPSLDALRGLAITLVLICHYALAPIRAAEPNIGPLTLAIREVLTLSWSGVDLFFVLSGYLIGGALLDHRDAPNLFSVFYFRRALRIWPLYGLLLAFVFLGLKARFSPWPYLTMTQNFLVADPWHASPWAAPWVRVTWSLAVEEQFYLVLPFIIRLTPRHHILKVILSGIAAAPIFRVMLWLALKSDTAPYLAYELLPTRMDALLLGTLAAWMMRDPRCHAWASNNAMILRRSIIVLLLIALAFVITGEGDLEYLAGSVFLYTVIALLYFCALLLICVRPLRATVVVRVFSYAGLIAYGLYLFQLPAIQLITVFLPRENSILQTAAALVSVVALANLSWRAIEKPAILLGKSARYKVASISRHPRDREIRIS